MSGNKLKRLAIISSYNENCGNASYTHVLKKALSKYYDVEVIPLDLFVLQKTSSTARRLGDRHIAHIAERLKSFDFVNIQFEAGLYGALVDDMLNRVSVLIKAAPNLIFTMHRIDLPGKSLARSLWTSVRSLSFRSIYADFRSHKLNKLYENLVRVCEKESKRKNVWINVHTKRERRIVQEYFDVENCFDHPLAYLNEAERSEAWKLSNRDDFARKHGFPKGAKIVGVFGYISAYKGLETAISTLSLLPSEFHLGFFGTLHPQSLKQNVAIDPYLKSLFELIETEEEKKLRQSRGLISMLSRLSSHQQATELKGELPKRIFGKKISERIRFIGSVDDVDFIEALRMCDAVVLPYLEVGQSMSGVVALATECGAKLFCANNASFSEVAKYYGPVFQSFDIGNHYELAQKITGGGLDFRDERDITYEKFNISKLARLMSSKFEPILTGQDL